jgi:hypothetical protein
MKTKIFILGISTLLVGACSSSYHATSVNDDLYYNPKNSKEDNVMAKNSTKTVASTPVATRTSANTQRNTLSDYERYRQEMETAEPIRLL